MSEKQAPYKMTGKVVRVGSEERVSDKFSKMTIVVDTEPNGKYHNPVAVDFGNDNIALIEDAQAGEMCEVRFYLNGYQGKKDPSYYGVGLKGVAYDVTSSAPESSDDQLPMGDEEAF